MSIAYSWYFAAGLLEKKWLNGLWNLLWINLITLAIKCNLNVLYTQSAQRVNNAQHINSSTLHYNQGNCPRSHCITFTRSPAVYTSSFIITKRCDFCIAAAHLPCLVLKHLMNVRIGHNPFTTSLHPLFLLLTLNFYVLFYNINYTHPYPKLKIWSSYVHFWKRMFLISN